MWLSVHSRLFASSHTHTRPTDSRIPLGSTLAFGSLHCLSLPNTLTVDVLLGVREGAPETETPLSCWVILAACVKLQIAPSCLAAREEASVCLSLPFVSPSSQRKSCSVHSWIRLGEERLSVSQQKFSHGRRGHADGMVLVVDAWRLL